MADTEQPVDDTDAPPAPAGADAQDVDAETTEPEVSEATAAAPDESTDENTES